MTTTSFTERYRAISSRDVRFDGQFVTAVTSTGIYCRPSCPARTPKEENVTFYETSAAAHEAGFRACKRCLPEAAPGSPAWDLRGDTASRAMRLIADGVVEREGVTGLASRLGYSSRHLTRLLGAELGAGPLSLARAQRAHTARMLLVGTDMSMADTAFAAGFASVRQFNDTMRAIFDVSPGELRLRRREHGHDTSGRIDLVLPYRAPIDLAGVFAWMSARAIDGMETATERSFSRVIALPGGPAWMQLSHEGTTLSLAARLTSLADLPVLVARARRLFDLDSDPLAIDSALAEIPEITALVAACPGIRVPGAMDPSEMLIRAMIGQQISVAAARTHITRLVAELGESTHVGPNPARLFPSMLAIAEHGAEVLRGPAARIRSVVEAARDIAEGRLLLSAGDDSAAQREHLLALRGVGPWTADYVRMRVTGDPDITLPGDVAVRSGARAVGIPDDATGFAKWAPIAAPWRSYLTAHLWRASSITPPTPRSEGATQRDAR